MKSLLLYVTLFLWSQALYAASYEGFTEAEREIQVSAAEAGVIDSLKVKEGQRVKSGEVLAALDTQVLNAALAVAKGKRGATGRLNAARAIERLRRERLERLAPLVAKGSAQQSELSQLQIEIEAAVAEVQAAREALMISELEYKQIESQIARRFIRSPIQGVITKLHKDLGELVGGNETTVVTLVSTDPIQATIHVPTLDALKMQTGQSVQVSFPTVDLPTATGKITFISPITEASSDTVKVTVQIANPENVWRIGVKCVVTTL